MFSELTFSSQGQHCLKPRLCLRLDVLNDRYHGDDLDLDIQSSL